MAVFVAVMLLFSAIVVGLLYYSLAIALTASSTTLTGLHSVLLEQAFVNLMIMSVSAID